MNMSQEAPDLTGLMFQWVGQMDNKSMNAYVTWQKWNLIKNTEIRARVSPSPQAFGGFYKAELSYMGREGYIAEWNFGKHFQTAFPSDHTDL